MITLYGSPRSSAGRCIWALEEAGVEFTQKEVDMRNKEHKSTDFLKINPMGKVPAMVDGNIVLFESMAINYYIADTYKKELLGTNALEKGLSMQWSFWATSELQPPIIEVFIQKTFVPEDKRDKNIIEKNLNKLPELLTVLNDSLTDKKYLAGDQFTIGDINTASVVTICPMMGVDLGAYPNIKNWLGAISERSAFQKYQGLRK
jgi:glutathione S-transferase